MSNPPNPHPTDRDQHAPGVSKTLEETAADNRKLWKEKPEEGADSEKEAKQNTAARD